MNNQEIKKDTEGTFADEKFKADYFRFRSLLDVIRNICKIAGFTIEGRIVLRDKRSGRVWR